MPFICEPHHLRLDSKGSRQEDGGEEVEGRDSPRLYSRFHMPVSAMKLKPHACSSEYLPSVHSPAARVLHFITCQGPSIGGVSALV